MSNDVIGNGLFALVAALIAVAYQYYQYRRQLIKSQKDKIADSKKKVIENLISYRFALSGRGAGPEAQVPFNAALSSIPVQFSHNKECMDNYKTIGDAFTADRFYELIIALMKDVPLEENTIDKHFLENIPIIK